MKTPISVGIKMLRTESAKEHFSKRNVSGSIISGQSPQNHQNKKMQPKGEWGSVLPL